MRFIKAVTCLFVFVLFITTPSLGQQSAQLPEGGKYWKPGHNNDRYGDPIAACDAMFYSGTINNGLTPNHYAFSYDSHGNASSVTCAQFGVNGGFSGGTTGHADLNCPGGYAKSGDDNFCSKVQNSGSECAGNPISVLNGEKVHSETDFVVGRGRLKFQRSYKSLRSTMAASALGAKWDSNFHPIVSSNYDGYRGYFTYRVPNGPVLRFIKDRGNWLHGGLPWGGGAGWFVRENKDRRDLKGYRIEQLPDYTIKITTPDNIVRSFDFDPPQGNSNNPTLIGLTSIQYPDGYEITLDYGTSELVQSVTDTDGYTINFTYTNRNLLESVTTPDGSVYKFEYAELGQAYLVGNSQVIGNTWRNYSVLTKVIYPDDTPGDDTDNTNKVYDYADRNYTSPNIGLSSFLTAITDERGIKIKEWDYEYTSPESGFRATASRGANGVDETTIEEIDRRKEYKVTNAKGKEATYHYIDKANVLRLDRIDGAATSNCAASSKSRGYDNNGYQTVSVDEEGNRTETSYDSTLGLPTQIKYGVGSSAQETVDIIWDSSTRQLTSVERSGLRAEYSYDSNQNLTQEKLIDTTSHSAPYSTNGQTRITTYAWTGDGLLQSIDGPLAGAGDTTSFTYDTNGNLASVTDTAGHTTVIGAVDAMGRPTQTTDANGLQLAIQYSTRGWVEQITQSHSGSSRTYGFTYDDAGNLTRSDLPNGGWLSYTYDDASWLTSVSSNAGDKLTYQYDLLGNITRSDYVTIGGSGRSYRTMAYDDLGRVISMLGGGGDVHQFSYDRANRNTSTTDGLGRTWLTGFDALNRVVSNTDPESHSVQMDYDTSGALASFSDARSLTTSYTRNGFGETIRTMSPDTGITDYWYDAVGRMTRTLSSAGRDVSYSYDSSGRILSETYPNQTAINNTFAYDSTQNGNTGGKGQLTSIASSWGSQSFHYNGFGDITSQEQVIDGKTYQTGYTYQASGELVVMTYPSGLQVQFSRDGIGRVSGLQARASGTSTFTDIISNVQREPFGPVKQYTAGSNLYASFTMDQSYRIDRLHVTSGASTILDKDYGYDANSRVTAISDGLDAAMDATFSYHLDGRLERAAGAWGDTGWDYDPVGNRLSEDWYSSGTLASTKTYAYQSNSNRLTSVSDSSNASTRSLTYTADGHIATDTRGSAPMLGYGYDQSGRLATLFKGLNTEATYKYDAFEHRVWRQDASGDVTHFVFAPSGMLLGEYDGATGAAIAEYIWLEDRLVASVDALGAITHVQTGHLGQPLLMTDAAGVVIWGGEMSPFGSYVATTGSASDPDLRLPGQWAEDGAGLSHNWHRDYDPSLGRYIEADPLGIAAGQSLYGYVNGDPLNATDPTGLYMDTNGSFGAQSRSRGGKFGRLSTAGLAAAAYTMGFDAVNDAYDQINARAKQRAKAEAKVKQSCELRTGGGLPPGGGGNWPPRPDRDDDDDPCVKRYKQEYDRCNTVRGISGNSKRWRAGCKERAMDRLVWCQQGIPDIKGEWPDS